MSMFVAACAERMAQLFTGPVGADTARSPDVDTVIRCLDLLWQYPSGTAWGEIAEAMKQFPELTGDEQSPGLLAYADDAAAAVYYAVKYRKDGDLTSVASCSNSALNSAEYISDLLDDGVDRYEIEVQNQQADMATLSGADASGDDLVRSLRERARESSRTRLTELMSA
ncbi:hypothetical protein [Jidongwangia harbinensis]|uniref:hypothetical protein n=1 Tax=Jidongwangia harbinensis TaxID=2878561 RepID=UPI001CDA3A39|nr:hypothetical protein [Jidongwangia harbinensis]MCA2211722.1 hypothetical protein [Jidongwangia harbinensis]